MKRLIILLIGLFFIVSCCSVRPGKLTGKWFRSTTCVDDARTPGLYVYFYPDGGFLYQMAYADGATGAWRIEGDTDILCSPDISIVLDSVLLPYGPRCWPNLNKYTDATDDNRDRYLVRGNKLYPIMKDGINELPLVKISKKQAKIELQDYPFYYNVKD